MAKSNKPRFFYVLYSYKTLVFDQSERAPGPVYIIIQADRLQMIVVANKNISVLQLFISRMPKMCAILQLVSALLNPIPIALVD